MKPRNREAPSIHLEMRKIRIPSRTELEVRYNVKYHRNGQWQPSYQFTNEKRDCCKNDTGVSM